MTTTKILIKGLKEVEKHKNGTKKLQTIKQFITDMKIKRQRRKLQESPEKWGYKG